MGDKNFHWWVASGSRPEHYGQYEETREAAIQVGKDEFGDDGFTIVEADKEVPGIMDGDDLWERFIENNEELGGEDSYFGENQSPTQDQFSELTTEFHGIFQAWMDRHNLNPHVWRFGTTRNEEYFPPINSETDDNA